MRRDLQLIRHRLRSWTRRTTPIRLYSTSKWKNASTARGEIKQLLAELNSCTNLLTGRAIHAKAVKGKKHPEICIINALISMYRKYGSMAEARALFDNIQKPNVVSWNTLLAGYAEHGEAKMTLDMFAQMKDRGCAPNSFTFVAVIKACTAMSMSGSSRDYLQLGKKIHLEAVCHMNEFVQGSLIDLYSKCGVMVEARRLFDSISKPNVIQWNAVLLGYAENGEPSVSLDLFSTMKECGYLPDFATYSAVIKACSALAASGDDGRKNDMLERGREIHKEIGSRLDHCLQNALVDMYGKCGSMDEAHRIFDSIYNPNVVSWTALISGYAENGEEHAALDLLSRMKNSGCSPDVVTYIAALKACGSTGALALGRKLHSEMNKFTPQVVTCLVDFYAKCGSMVEAQEVFDTHSNARDVTSWTALLAGYSRFGDSRSVFDLFEAMQGEGLQPNSVTFVCLLLCCSHAGLVEKAEEYFEAMPSKYRVSPTAIHYTCMVDVLGRANQLDKAVTMIRKMPFSPDEVTWTSLLGACRKWKNVEIGREAFQALAGMGKIEASPYVLMGNLYGSKADICEEEETMLETSSKFGARELPEAYSTDQMGEIPAP